MLKADLHIHTRYSMDCDTPLERIVSRCHAVGVNCIAIADHDTIEGAQRMQEMAPFPVVLAEEILTPQGEIMGVFLTERVPSGVTIRQAIDLIHAQDALVCLPHPFDTLRRLRLGEREMAELAAEIDVVEAFNARSPLPWPTLRAQAYADRHGIPQSAGSDAHSTREIGRTFVVMPEFEGKEGYLRSLAAGTITGRKTNTLVHLISLWAKIRKAL